MAVKWIHQVWESDLKWSGSKLLVMLALADYAKDDEYFWPSVGTVAKKCRLSERQAQRIIIGEKGVTGDIRRIQKRVTSSAKWVTSTARKGDTAMSPDPSTQPSVE